MLSVPAGSAALKKSGCLRVVLEENTSKMPAIAHLHGKERH